MKTKPRSQESLLTQSRPAAPAISSPKQVEVPDRGEDSRRFALLLFSLAFIVVVLASFLVSKKNFVENHEIDLSNVEQRRRLEASVNRHIQLTNRKIETDKERIKVEAAFTIPRVGHLVSIERRESPSGKLDLRGDRSEYNSARDLDRRGESAPTKFADDIVHEEMRERELQSAAEQALRKEYARQYVENARRNGYEVKIDDQLRITEVKELAPRREASGDAYR